MVQIYLVRSRQDADTVRELAYEFIAWLRARYPDMEAEVDAYLAEQQFEEQIKEVLIHYAPPRGECLLAVHDRKPAGLLMLKRLSDDTCEMNRMFVRDAARGCGVGRNLVERLKERAREMGFTSMVLSALPRHHEALALYENIGFVRDDWTGNADDTSGAIHMRAQI